MDLCSKFLPACQKFRQIRVGEREGNKIPSRSPTLLNYIRMYYSYPIGRVRMKFSPHVKVKNSFPRGRRPQGEEFFTFTRGENSFLPTRLGKSSILMYFCNKLEGEKNLRKSFFFPIGIKKNLSFSLLRNFYVKSFIKKLTCREKE